MKNKLSLIALVLMLLVNCGSNSNSYTPKEESLPNSYQTLWSDGYSRILIKNKYRAYELLYDRSKGGWVTYYCYHIEYKDKTCLLYDDSELKYHFVISEHGTYLRTEKGEKFYRIKEDLDYFEDTNSFE